MSPIRKHQVFLMISMLFLASLACNFPRQNAEKSLDAEQQTPLSIDGVLDAQGALQVVLNEAQLTSLVENELSAQDDPVLREPQVFLRDGQMILAGRVQQAGLNADLEMVMEVGVTPDGKPDVTVISASVGLFALPQDMLDNISAQIKSAFESKIDQGIDKIFIDQITIDDGEMVILGHAR